MHVYNGHCPNIGKKKKKQRIRNTTFHEICALQNVFSAELFSSSFSCWVMCFLFFFFFLVSITSWLCFFAVFSMRELHFLFCLCVFHFVFVFSILFLCFLRCFGGFVSWFVQCFFASWPLCYFSSINLNYSSASAS